MARFLNWREFWGMGRTTSMERGNGELALRGETNWGSLSFEKGCSGRSGRIWDKTSGFGCDIAGCNIG